MKNGMFVEAFGFKRWYKNDQIHREDGPAIEGENGVKYWYIHGVRHRIDGPACEYADGSKEWWVNGRLHREDGPAIERTDGSKRWRINGVRHREDGPAIERVDGRNFWYVNDVEVTEQIVMWPETITLEQISEEKNAEVRSIMIERFGWLRYIQDSKANLLDSRDNAIENTKEALFAAGELGNRLVVTCPTGRVFVLGVPLSRKTCEAAQQWLGKADKKINVIGRT